MGIYSISLKAKAILYFVPFASSAQHSAALTEEFTEPQIGSSSRGAQELKNPWARNGPLSLWWPSWQGAQLWEKRTWGSAVGTRSGLQLGRSEESTSIGRVSHLTLITEFWVDWFFNQRLLTLTVFKKRLRFRRSFRFILKLRESTEISQSSPTLTHAQPSPL